MSILIALLLSGAAHAADPRFCGPPARNAHGEIVRSTKVLADFERQWPKPVDGRTWYIDHIVPLACGGCDALQNLQWLPGDLKTCAGKCKDRWERKVYGGHAISQACP